MRLMRQKAIAGGAKAPLSRNPISGQRCKGRRIAGVVKSFKDPAKDVAALAAEVREELMEERRERELVSAGQLRGRGKITTPGKGTQADGLFLPVRFVLRQHCSFGETFAICGGHPSLGAWDPSQALQLQWSDGDVWTGVAHLPVDRQVEFKYICRRADGIVQYWGSEGLGKNHNNALFISKKGSGFTPVLQPMFEGDQPLLCVDLESMEGVRGTLSSAATAPAAAAAAVSEALADVADLEPEAPVGEEIVDVSMPALQAEVNLPVAADIAGLDAVSGLELLIDDPEGAALAEHATSNEFLADVAEHELAAHAEELSANAELFMESDSLEEALQAMQPLAAEAAEIIEQHQQLLELEAQQAAADLLESQVAADLPGSELTPELETALGEALQQALEPQIVDMPPQAVPDVLPDCINSPSPMAGEGVLLDMAEELMTPSEAQATEFELAALAADVSVPHHLPASEPELGAEPGVMLPQTPKARAKHSQAAGEEHLKTDDISISDPAAALPIVSSGRTFGNRRGSANSGASQTKPVAGAPKGTGKGAAGGGSAYSARAGKRAPRPNPAAILKDLGKLLGLTPKDKA